MANIERTRELSRGIARDIIDLAREIDEKTKMGAAESIAIATKAHEIAVQKAQNEALLRIQTQQADMLERIATRMQWMA